MDVKQIGKIVKELRLSRGISLKEATGQEFSASMLSRFENGESDLTTLKLLTVLENIRTEPSEFFYLVRGFQPSAYTLLMTKIREAQDKNDVEYLWECYYEARRTYKETGKASFLLNALMIKGSIQLLDSSVAASQEELDFLYDYLFSVDIWGEYELKVFTEIAVLLPLESYFRYCREMLNKIDYFEEFFLIRNRIHTILLNGLFLALDKKDIHKANYFDKQLQIRFFEENETHLRIVYRFALGMLDYLTGHQEEGKVKMQEVVHILETLDCHNVATYYREAMKEVLAAKKE